MLSWNNLNERFSLHDQMILTKEISLATSASAQWILQADKFIISESVVSPENIILFAQYWHWVVYCYSVRLKYCPGFILDGLFLEMLKPGEPLIGRDWVNNFIDITSLRVPFVAANGHSLLNPTGWVTNDLLEWKVKSFRRARSKFVTIFKRCLGSFVI